MASDGRGGVPAANGGSAAGPFVRRAWGLLDIPGPPFASPGAGVCTGILTP